MPLYPPAEQIVLARPPQACSLAPPRVLAKVTSMQSARAGAPLVSPYATSPSAAMTTHASTAAMALFSRRPQRSGCESLLD